jgi:ATP-binding cassette subfamily C exporter for protease/lipase
MLLLVPAVYMIQIYDRVLISRSELTLIFLSIITLFLFMVMALSEWLRSKLLIRVGLRIDEALNKLVFNASFKSFLNFKKDNPSDLLLRLTGLRQFLTGAGISTFFDLPWTPIFIAIIFLLHPVLGYLATLFAFIQLAIVYFTNRSSEEIDLHAAKAEERNASYLYNKLKNPDSVESMGMLGNLRSNWLLYHNDYQQQMKIAFDKLHKQQAVNKFIRYTMQSFILGVGALLVIKSELSMGGMIAGNIIASRALRPIDSIVGAWKQFIEAKTSFLKIEKLLADYPEGDSEIHYPIPKGQMTLKKMFAYAPNRKAPILNKLDIKFNLGRTVAIVGPSGSGKSTLAKCLIGIWPDIKGELLLDGTPIKNWDREQLGPYIGYVPQDIQLFDGTIAENIARFETVDPEKVVEASTHVGIHDMILKLPLGYDTKIGVGGSLLSGGQKQRLALARAIYNNPVMLVLDEPNSNLDEQGDIALDNVIKKFKVENKTIFIVTHRQNILQLADDILEVKQGAIEKFEAIKRQ